jgi:hypothetical protein
MSVPFLICNVYNPRRNCLANIRDEKNSHFAAAAASNHSRLPSGVLLLHAAATEKVNEFAAAAAANSAYTAIYGPFRSPCCLPTALESLYHPPPFLRTLFKSVTKRPPLTH